MEKQTVYIPVDEENENRFGWVTPSIKNMKGDKIDIVPVEKKENVYVFTEAEFEKAIGDAFDAGSDYTEFHLSQGFLGITNPNPDKTEYLNNLK